MPHTTGGAHFKLTIFILLAIFVKEIAGRKLSESSTNAPGENKAPKIDHDNTF
jgi:hypothetical protein